MACVGCGSPHVQNKKYQLCGECVFKKSHGGKSKGEVYQERSTKKQSLNKEIQSYNEKAAIFNNSLKSRTYTPSTYNIIGGDEEGMKNAMAQDAAEEREKTDQGIVEGFGRLPAYKDNKERICYPKKKQKSVKRITENQKEINIRYKLVCADMDYTTEPVCTGCLRYQGGDIKLSHSHIISRKECKEIGREELIYERDNLTYHCLDFGENEGCHRIWENPKRRHELKDYEQNMKYRTSILGQR